MADERAFRAWYAKHAKKWKLDEDPDNPEHHYDYRKAFAAGDEPDDTGHWPSRWKDDTHPNLVVGGVNTKTGERQSMLEGKSKKKKRRSFLGDN